MCRWMGSHFHNWTDCNGATFLVELPGYGVGHFRDFWDMRILESKDLKMGRFAVKLVGSCCLLNINSRLT